MRQQAALFPERGAPNGYASSSIATFLLGSIAAVPAAADSCGGIQDFLRPGNSVAVSYAARHYEPGYRFSLAGLDWELREALVDDHAGHRTFSVVYPELLSARKGVASRDFFFSIDASEVAAADCSDMPVFNEAEIDDWLTEDTLFVTDDYRSQLRPGAFSESLRRLQTVRTLATRLRLRDTGFEVVLATGFTSTRSMSLDACLHTPGDTIGIVENGPGEVHVTCFPEDDAADFVSNIDWVVDYRWPDNAPALLDELIDYVHVKVRP